MFTEEQFSPDGRYLLRIAAIPMRMSHEVNSPSLIEVETQTVIFDPGNMWDAGKIQWSEDSKTLQMGFRLYPDGNIYFDLVIDLAAGLATLIYNEKTALNDTLAEVQKTMKETYNARSLTKLAK